MQGAAFVLNPSPPAFARAIASTASQNAQHHTKGITMRNLPSVSSRRRWRPTCVAQQQEQDYVVYDEKKSVFPAEACEEVGGESCQVEGVGPEVKGQAAPAKQQPVASALGGPDREYVDYVKDNKTVFPGEACDELGGEFCEPEYQAGVFPDKSSSSSSSAAAAAAK